MKPGPSLDAILDREPGPSRWDVPREVEDQLSAAGFAKKGRHWVHAEGQIFIELPARVFDQGTRTDTVVFGEQMIIVISPEDLLIDRLAAWQFWKVTVEGINAFLLWRDRGPTMNAARLEDVAAKAGLRTALRSLRSFASQWGQESPSMEEVERWARQVQ